MNRLNRPIRLCLPWATIAFLAGALAAQPNRKEPIRLEQDVKPAFRVNPIVHHFEARRGATIPFEFELESIKRATSVKIRAVAASHRTLQEPPASACCQAVVYKYPDRWKTALRHSRKIKNC